MRGQECRAQGSGVEEGEGGRTRGGGVVEIVVLEITHIHSLQANLGSYSRQY